MDTDMLTRQQKNTLTSNHMLGADRTTHTVSHTKCLECCKHLILLKRRFFFVCVCASVCASVYTMCYSNGKGSISTHVGHQIEIKQGYNLRLSCIKWKSLCKKKEQIHCLSIKFTKPSEICVLESFREKQQCFSVLEKRKM